ncbi:MAG: metalloendopeptidase, partial [Pseudobdellovibrio sp.]
IEDDSITKAQTAVNEILKNLNQKKQQEDSLSKSTQRKVWEAATPSLTAGFLDTLLITAFFLLSLVIMLAITKIDLVANLTQPDPQYLIYWATLSLLAGIQIIYFVSCRAYLGCTPGEWAFDQRCGNEVQLASSTYTLRVMARSILNIVTGFVTFSIISAIVKFDVLSALTGLQVQKQKLVKPQ